jgi:hypothetical protein
MSENLRWMLVVGCLMIAALEAPRTTLLLAEDLGGPYAPAAVGSGAVEVAQARFEYRGGDVVPDTSVERGAARR